MQYLLIEHLLVFELLVVVVYGVGVGSGFSPWSWPVKS